MKTVARVKMGTREVAARAQTSMNVTSYPLTALPRRFVVWILKVPFPAHHVVRTRSATAHKLIGASVIVAFSLRLHRVALAMEVVKTDNVTTVAQVHL